MLSGNMIKFPNIGIGNKDKVTLLIAVWSQQPKIIRIYMPGMFFTATTTTATTFTSSFSEVYISTNAEI